MGSSVTAGRLVFRIRPRTVRVNDCPQTALISAGHDNCNYDSYQRQLERLLQPVMETAKVFSSFPEPGLSFFEPHRIRCDNNRTSWHLQVQFTVRNGGEGGGCGDSYENQVWCTRSILGDDADLAHYSWTYFENSDVLKEHEQFLRWNLMMARSPAATFITTGYGMSKMTYPCAHSLYPRSCGVPTIVYIFSLANDIPEVRSRTARNNRSRNKKCWTPMLHSVSSAMCCTPRPHHSIYILPITYYYSIVLVLFRVTPTCRCEWCLPPEWPCAPWLSREEVGRGGRRTPQGHALRRR